MPSWPMRNYRTHSIGLLRAGMVEAGDSIVSTASPTTGLLDHVLVANHQDHLPLYRQEHSSGRAGLAIPRSTLVSWVGQYGVQLQTLIDVRKEVTLRRQELHADEIPLAMLEPGNKKTHQA